MGNGLQTGKPGCVNTKRGEFRRLHGDLTATPNKHTHTCMHESVTFISPAQLQHTSDGLGSEVLVIDCTVAG